MRNKTIISLFAALLLSVFVVGSIAAQAPNTITYQGKLVNITNGDPITTATTVVFSLYAADQGGSALWTETHNITPDEGGIFTIELGGTASLATVLNGSKRYLGLKFGADTEMSPRQLITSTAYAYSAEKAASATTVPNASITGAKLASNAVTSAKIATGGVAESDIASSAVTSSKLASNAVTTTKIATGGVGSTDIASGAVTSTKLANNAVTTDKIADGSVTTAKLAGAIVGPIAMGWISSAGVVEASSGNISCTYNATYTRYEITITGHSYYFNDYVTVVTVGNAGDYTANMSSVSGKMLISFRNTSGTTVKLPSSGFQFVTYKP